MQGERLTTKEMSRRLRKESTPAESFVWGLLRGKRLYGLKFRRQHPLKGFIVDFYCYEHGFCIELDGAPHFEPGRSLRDVERDAHLRSMGFKVLRLTNDEAVQNPEWLRQRIIDACRAESMAPPL